MAEYRIVEDSEYWNLEDFLTADERHLKTYAKLVGKSVETIKKWIETGDLYEHSDSDDVEIERVINELHKDTINLVSYNAETDRIEVIRITDGYTEIKCKGCNRSFKIKPIQKTFTCPYCNYPYCTLKDLLDIDVKTGEVKKFKSQ